ncbi:MAG TPA: phosphatase PAP2 family protein [Gaiellaceae bacterium]|nr:phosphatase PAP2 family protein [Gaiellaceae bacterium]
MRAERFFSIPRDAVRAGAALLAAVGLGAILIPTGPLGIDERWADAMKDVHSDFLRRVALLFNSLGIWPWRTVALAAIACILLATRRLLALVTFAVAEALAPLLSSLLKMLVDRPRPPGGLVNPVGSSYPSGHATDAGTTAVALVLLFTAAGRGRRPWWIAAGLGIAVMAWSRTYLHVHWLSDVVAGAALGIGIALVVFGAAQWRRQA